MPETPTNPTPGQSINRSNAERLGAQVYALVRACPPGHVTTYGWLAAGLGFPRGARMVGWFMNHSPRWEEVPAHRVINSKGELSGSWAFGQRGRMREMLEAEGVQFSGEGRVDLKRYGWDPSRDLTGEERANVLASADAGAPADVDDELFRLLMDDPASPFRIQPTGQ